MNIFIRKDLEIKNNNIMDLFMDHAGEAIS
jgi:hypothetical protein